ncbi:MAG: hypothetical protein EAZ61_02240 [Oscillatoriales cyanobacterium]|nr:MAG: hypothetical protein EAZ61_02240 [Oscillatoriales cyanobacterium]
MCVPGGGECENVAGFGVTDRIKFDSLQAGSIGGCVLYGLFEDVCVVNRSYALCENAVWTLCV